MKSRPRSGGVPPLSFSLPAAPAHLLSQFILFYELLQPFGQLHVLLAQFGVAFVVLFHLQLDVIEHHLEVGCYLLPLLFLLPSSLDTLLLWRQVEEPHRAEQQRQQCKEVRLTNPAGGAAGPKRPGFKNDELQSAIRKPALPPESKSDSLAPSPSWPVSAMLGQRLCTASRGLDTNSLGGPFGQDAGCSFHYMERGFLSFCILKNMRLSYS